MAARDKVTPIRTVVATVGDEDRRGLLVALRERLWEALHDDRTQPRDLSPLTLRIKELQAEIADLDGRDDEEEEVPDEPFTADDL